MRDAAMRAFLNELYETGRQNDEREQERGKKMLNLEPETAQFLYAGRGDGQRPHSRLFPLAGASTPGPIALESCITWLVALRALLDTLIYCEQARTMQARMMQEDGVAAICEAVENVLANISEQNPESPAQGRLRPREL